MKKILLALAAVFMLNACSEADPENNIIEREKLHTGNG